MLRRSTRLMSHIKRVAIIGGGPSAVAVAKHLLAEKHFTKIDIFEQRSRTGGVWDYYNTDKDGIKGTFACPVPHTSPADAISDEPLRRDSGYGEPQDGRVVYLSPLYDRLEANLPKMLMQHSDLPFSDDDQLFPTHRNITDYLERYATEDVRKLIHYETQVISAEPDQSTTNTVWTMTTRNVTTKAESTSQYDALVVANGHYNIPFIPSLPNISLWNQEHPEIITHSKFYKDPSIYTNKKVLTIGIGPSGQDIASQISNYASELFVSTRRPPSSPSMIPSKATHVPGISSFLTGPNDPPRSIQFTDGRVESHFDAVLFCTGYLYSYPFLPESITNSEHCDPSENALLKTNGTRVHNIYQHIFYTPNPSLVFTTLPWNIVPFPVSENQGAVIARVWSGRLSLPSDQELREWEKDGEEQWGDGKTFHQMPPPRDIEYVNYLYRWAESAKKREGLERDGRGKEPAFWAGDRAWMRKNVGMLKGKFFGLGEGRRDVRTIEELGVTVGQG